MQMKSTLVLVVVAVCSCGTPATNDAGTPVVVDAGADGGALVIDAGFDAGLDAGDVDAGVPDDAGAADAGVDAGVDAGLDAGVDAGLDAGADAGLDAGVDAGVDAGPGFDASLPDGGVRVRIIAANLTSGNLQNYDLGEGQRILQALEGDIVGIQEFNVGDSSDASISAWVDATFDAGFYWTRGSGRIPNGVISRYPILDAGEWDDTRATDREFTWAVIDVPGPNDLWVVSLHLLSGAGPTARTAQATALVQLLNANVSAGTHVALVGDFNTDSRVENCLGALDASVVVQAPWPSDYSLPDGGNHNTSTNRGKPYDWVAVSPSLHRQMIPVVLGSQFFPAGLVFDTRVFTPLPSPALFGDSMSTNMQHMAVVRDFVLLQ